MAHAMEAKYDGQSLDGDWSDEGDWSGVELHNLGDILNPDEDLCEDQDYQAYQRASAALRLAMISSTGPSAIKREKQMEYPLERSSSPALERQENPIDHVQMLKNFDNHYSLPSTSDLPTYEASTQTILPEMQQAQAAAYYQWQQPYCHQDQLNYPSPAQAKQSEQLPLEQQPESLIEQPDQQPLEPQPNQQLESQIERRQDPSETIAFLRNLGPSVASLKPGRAGARLTVGTDETYYPLWNNSSKARLFFIFNESSPH